VIVHRSQGFLTQSALPNPLWSARVAQPKQAALAAGGLTCSARDLTLGVTRAAGRLAQAGIGPGDHVALCGPPSPSWVIALHAIGWVGATAVPLPPNAPRPELARRLELADADHLLLTHGLDAAARATLRSLRAEARFLNELPLGPAPRERFWPLDEPRVIVFTSGSTGAANAVPLATSQLVMSAFGSAIRLGHDPSDRWLACLPFHHVGGLSILYRCAFYGTTVVLHERFRPEAVAQALDAGDATLVSLVPTMLEQVLDARPQAPFPSTLRAVLLGGDATPPALLERCRALKVPVALTWGMTETASQVATRAPGDLAPDTGCGAPLPFARVESRAGVLTVRGPLAGGEVRTRDLGRIDASGRVHVAGREEGFIVSGGETVALGEVEAVLAAHPRVAEAAVIGMTDPRWGERPLALVVARDPRLDAGEVEAWCRDRLSGFKVPARFEVVPSLPRTELGKLARAELGRRFAVNASPPPPQAARPTAPPAPEPVAAQPVVAALLAAAEEHGAQGLRGRLDEAERILGDDMAALADELQGVASALQRPPRLAARRAARDLLANPGKRLRPLCALLAARVGGTPRLEAARCVAVASELIHTATLLHDDVIDEGSERRGAPAARVVYGNSASVLAGDFLFAEALRIIGETDEPALMTQFLRVIADMVEAEALQLERRGRLEPSRDAYLAVCRGKTGVLFQWALAAGGLVGGLTPSDCDALGRAGQALGLAFQLVDDVLDLAGDPERIGKDSLADLRQGKLTWPWILALERDPSLAERVAAAVAGDAPELGRLVADVRAAGTVEETKAFAREQAQAALADLATLPDGWARWLLEAIVHLIVDRTR
jgi:O-succinylbenzoic acid--CoA ligase